MSANRELRVSSNFPSGVRAEGAAIAVCTNTQGAPWTQVGLIPKEGDLRVRIGGWIPENAREVIVQATIEDASGVRWGSQLRVHLRESASSHHVGLGLSRLHQALPNSYVSGAAKKFLASEAHGTFLLDDLEEAITALQDGLPCSAAVVSGRAAHGAIRLKGELEGFWNDEWNEWALGRLVEREETRAIRNAIEGTPALGHGYLVRLRGSLLTRNMAAHPHWTRVTLSESIAGWVILVELVNAWFGSPMD